MPRYAPFARAEVPAAPSHLTEEQRELFDQAAQFLLARNSLGSADGAAIERYAVAVSMARALDREIAARGVVDAKGHVTGLLAHSHAAHSSVRSWSRLLGIGPASRARMPVGQPDEDLSSPLGALLAPHKGRPAKAS
jgi:phage terminase small subunit